MASLELFTLADCGLRISGYPPFRYDARGGRGTATLDEAGAVGLRDLRFDPASLTIPALSWRTTRVLGLPLPPGLQIAIEPRQLSGELDPVGGAIALEFTALFHCSVGRLYQPPPLLIATTLGTGTASGLRHCGEGSPLAADGHAVLVGVAQVAPSGDRWLDRFLGLPDEALAVLRCRLSSPSGALIPPAPPPDRSAPGQSAPA